MAEAGVSDATGKDPERGRFVEIDFLRGLAAVTVLFGHLIHIVDNSLKPLASQDGLFYWLRISPLSILIAAHEAVLLFFVLSGFVLSLQFLDPVKAPRYSAYLTRRIFRIYVPYVVAILVALLLAQICPRVPAGQLDAWFQAPWKAPISASVVVDHLLFLGDFDNDKLDPVIWSLVQEMRISILFPALVAALLRLSLKQNLGLMMLCMIGGISANLIWIRIWHAENDFLLTLSYTGPFVLGFVISRYITAIRSIYSGWSLPCRFALLVAGFCLYAYSALLPDKLRYLSDIPITVGAAVFVVVSLSSKLASESLRSAPARFLGRISYSFYLYHALIILCLTHSLYGTVPTWALLLLIVGLTLVVAILAHAAVEVPAIRAGRVLSKRWPARKKANAAANGMILISEPHII